MSCGDLNEQCIYLAYHADRLILPIALFSSSTNTGGLWLKLLDTSSGAEIHRQGN